VPVRYAVDLRYLVDRLTFTTTNNARTLIFSDSPIPISIAEPSSTSAIASSSSSSSPSSSALNRTKRAKMTATATTTAITTGESSMATITPLESLTTSELELRVTALLSEREVARQVSDNGHRGPLAVRQKYRRADDALRHARRILDDVEEDDDTIPFTDVEELFDLFGDALFPYTHLLSSDAPPPLPLPSTASTSASSSSSVSRTQKGDKRKTKRPPISNHSYDAFDLRTAFI
jgi:hypothetical protein